MNNRFENEEEEMRKEGEPRTEDGKGREDDRQTDGREENSNRLKVDHQRNSGTSARTKLLNDC